MRKNNNTDKKSRIFLSTKIILQKNPEFLREKNFLPKLKLHLCASGSILLPLAQKWGLGCATAVAMLSALGAQSVSAASLKLELPSSGTLSLAVQPDGQLHSQASGAIKITSDAYAGYTFSISSKDNTNALKDGAKSILSIDAESDDASFPMNRWGFKWTGGAKPATKYQPGPTTGTEIDKTDKANNDKANEYTITLGAKVDYNTVPGTYSNSFVLTVTANDVPYAITYHLNEGTGISTLQSGNLPEGDSIEISKAPTRAGYSFAGWCEQETTSETCGGKVYQPGETYTLGNSDNALGLYAIWAQKMQDWKGCNTLGDKIAYLEDSRDNNIYTVARLKDGNCWMTQNLRLGKVGETMLLTSADSDIQNNFTLPESNISKFYFQDFEYNPLPGVTEGAKRYDNDAFYLDQDEDSEYGGYYTWHTAVAGSGDINTLNQDVPSSICAKGWKLPSQSDYELLIKYYPTSDVFMAQPIPGFLLGGTISTRQGEGGKEGVGGQGSIGCYWSSSALEYYTIAYNLTFYGSQIVGRSNVNRFDGRSVRCLVRQ